MNWGIWLFFIPMVISVLLVLFVYFLIERDGKKLPPVLFIFSLILSLLPAINIIFIVGLITWLIVELDDEDSELKMKNKKLFKWLTN